MFCEPENNGACMPGCVAADEQLVLQPGAEPSAETDAGGRDGALQLPEDLSAEGPPGHRQVTRHRRPRPQDPRGGLAARPSCSFTGLCDIFCVCVCVCVCVCMCVCLCVCVCVCMCLCVCVAVTVAGIQFNKDAVTWFSEKERCLTVAGIQLKKDAVTVAGFRKRKIL